MKKIFENEAFEVFENDHSSIVVKYKNQGASLTLIRGGLGIDLKTDGHIVRHPVDLKSMDIALVLPPGYPE